MVKRRRMGFGEAIGAAADALPTEDPGVAPAAAQEAVHKVPPATEYGEAQVPPQAPTPLPARRGVPARKAPETTPAFGRIVETVNDRARVLLEDPGTYARLEAALEVQGAATPERVKAVLNTVDRAAADAHLAYLGCKEEFARFERELDVYEAPWREEAMKKLEALKADKKMSKVIAEADVRSTMATLYADEWRAAEDRRARAKLTVDQFGRIAELLQKRAYSLAAMLPQR